MKITELGLVGLQDELFHRRISSVEVTQAFLDEAQAAEPLNTFTQIDPEQALAQARQADQHEDPADWTLMTGIPVAVKDLFCTKGLRSQAGSRALEGFVPNYESFVTQKLRDAGAVILGKTNMDEFAMGSSSETGDTGAVVSPWRSQGSTSPLTAGGSSGGSAAAVAAGAAPAALGSDTGGSIRQPAAHTGIVGLKPTYGRCSRWGMISFASSLDQAGVFARDVADAALLIDAISGHDPRDATSVPAETSRCLEGLKRPKPKLRIGIPKEYHIFGLSHEIMDLWHKTARMLESWGAELVEISLPHTRYALPAYYIIAPAEASSNLARYDGIRYGHRAESSKGSLESLYEQTRAEGFGMEVKQRILIGTYALSQGYYEEYYLKAQKVRAKVTQDFTHAFLDGVDAILTPTTPEPAFALGQKHDSPISMYLNDIFTVPASLAGLPAVSFPVGLSPEGLPLGMQLIGKPWSEDTILYLAHQVEQASPRLPKPEPFWKTA